MNDYDDLPYPALYEGELKKMFLDAAGDGERFVWCGEYSRRSDARSAGSIPGVIFALVTGLAGIGLLTWAVIAADEPILKMMLPYYIFMVFFILIGTNLHHINKGSSYAISEKCLYGGRKVAGHCDLADIVSVDCYKGSRGCGYVKYGIEVEAGNKRILRKSYLYGMEEPEKVAEILLTMADRARVRRDTATYYEGE